MLLLPLFLPRDRMGNGPLKIHFSIHPGELRNRTTSNETGRFGIWTRQLANIKRRSYHWATPLGIGKVNNTCSTCQWAAWWMLLQVHFMPCPIFINHFWSKPARILVSGFYFLRGVTLIICRLCALFSDGLNYYLVYFILITKKNVMLWLNNTNMSNDYTKSHFCKWILQCLTPPAIILNYTRYMVYEFDNY